MILKEPIVITQEQINDLFSVQKKLLFLNNKSGLIVITNFSYKKEIVEEVVKKRFFKPDIKQKIEKIFLTEIEVWSYRYLENYNQCFWGKVLEDHIWLIFSFYDLKQIRWNFENLIIKPLKDLGFKIEKDIKTEIKNQEQ